MRLRGVVNLGRSGEKVENELYEERFFHVEENTK